MNELLDAVRELMEHLEEFCEFPQNPREKKLSNAVYQALAKAEAHAPTEAV